MRAYRYCVAVLVASLLIVAPAQAASLADQWVKYRDRFITQDGRVRDTANKEISHTEGQGSAMLFAQAFDDRATFDRVWRWTQDKLRRPDSALFSWRWDPSNTANPIADTNNASDGDILIAWSLCLAAKRWHDRDYTLEARRIATEIRTKLIDRKDGRLVLMPGADGFKFEDGSILVNPSYYIFPAFREFSRVDPSPDWQRLRRDGLVLLNKARFGQWGLTPDWITLTDHGVVSPAASLPPRFGFDAIRIPLYLVWDGAGTPQSLAADRRYWDAFAAANKPVPAWIDVTNGNIAPFPAPAGFRAIIQLAQGRYDPSATPMPEIGDTDDYYSASLTLLAGLARQATGR